ncbi:ShlB/FhaC/HecB family hemolysin secretion/activation protein [Leptolyngbya sp. AS-A5]|uniref:ShlB/FhaC/HecB family hemolysin secretion/activation protein n=2 Tax=unclassified Leptolyngbya TaxID=2650499 RepID=UPI003296D880
MKAESNNPGVFLWIIYEASMVRCQLFLFSTLLNLWSLRPASAESIPSHLLAQALPATNPLPQALPNNQQPAPTPTNETTPESSKVLVRRIEVQGSTVLKPEEIQRITQPIEGKSATVEDLQSVADGITQLYLERGFITSRAILVDQTVKEGVVQIRVIEGSIKTIEIRGLQHLREQYVRDRLQIGTKPPFNKNYLEDQLQLLKADPLFETVEASLKPGENLGQSILTIQIKEAAQLQAFIGADNFSPASVGSERFSTTVSCRNLARSGDELSASYYRTAQGGSNSFDFSYQLPVNAMNGVVQLRIAPSRGRIIAPNFSAFGIRSNTALHGISYRQPLIRSPREELALSIGFTVQNGQTFLFQDTPFPFGIGADAEGNSRARVLQFGQDYVRRDPQGAWVLRSQFNFGLNVFNATVNDSPIPDGRFFSWLGQVQRVQRLSNEHFLIAQAAIQLSPDSLLPSQQFIIGGGQTIRGFRQNARSGDNGFRVSVEDRITVQRNAAGLPVLQLVPFVDFGTVWNRSDNPNLLPSQRFLSSGGVGLILEPIPRLTMRADYAVPFVRLSDRGNNAQDRGFTFSVGYRF